MLKKKRNSNKTLWPSLIARPLLPLAHMREGVKQVGHGVLFELLTKWRQAVSSKVPSPPLAQDEN